LTLALHKPSAATVSGHALAADFGVAAGVASTTGAAVPGRVCVTRAYEGAAAGGEEGAAAGGGAMVFSCGSGAAMAGAGAVPRRCVTPEARLACLGSGAARLGTLAAAGATFGLIGSAGTAATGAGAGAGGSARGATLAPAAGAAAAAAALASRDHSP
jgi:hypothetical protein